MGCWYNCAECGEGLYSVASVDFGSGHFCELCWEKLNLETVQSIAEDYCSKLPFCDPSEDLELFMEQLEEQDRICDMFYQELKATQLK